MTEFSAGTWLALVTRSGVALVADAPPAARGGLSAALETGSLAAFLEAFVAATGTSLLTLPAFAVALAEPTGVRVAVRGEATALGDDGVALAGAGVTGWAEAVWEGGGAILASPEPEGEQGLWLAEGAVRASRVRWRSGGAESGTGETPLAEAEAVDVRAAAAPAPEPAVEPAPVAEAAPAVEPAPAVRPTPEVEPAPSDEPVSYETLAPAYDTIAVEGEAVPYDTVFGSLWGAGEGAATPTRATPEPAQAAHPAPPSTAATGPVPASTPAPAPDPAPAPLPPLDPPPPPPPGDHDGATISVAALRALQQAPPSGEASVAVPSFASAEQLARESQGRAVVSTGAVVTLDRNVIVGRTPKASRVTGQMPHLVTVPSPSQDISRSHVELRVEGTAVVAVDLNTTNGTLVRRPGAEPVRLHPGEPHVLLTGDVIDLGDGVTIVMEDLP